MEVGGVREGCKGGEVVDMTVVDASIIARTEEMTVLNA